MGTYSSGEELAVKTRKPYTITKQRERWTEDEHNRFLEALKLYGRAWQRIEEHIGTKTAVQIRSHAQKFFTKLEKEALVKGVPVGQALDIDIPPPRPKRKPSNPYPRKTSVGASTSPVGAKDGKLSPVASSLCPSKQILDLEKEPLPEKLGGEEKSGNSEKNHHKDGCSEVLNLFQEPHCTSLSSANKNAMPPSVASGSTCTFREFMPMIKGVINQDETNESYVSAGSKGNQSEHYTQGTGHEKYTSNISCSKNTKPSVEEPVRGEKADEQQQQPKIFSSIQSNDMQGTQHYPRHVSVHVLDGSLGMSTQNVSPEMSCQESTFHQMGNHGQSNLFTNPAASATTEHHTNATTSSFHQSFPAFHPPFTTVHNNQNDYESSLHISPTFSNLIVSTLTQNPAAHAAASFAAAFWPYTSIEGSLDSLAGAMGGFPSRQMNPAPSMAAIAAATVAAAAAWWAAHGLLPLCAPLYTGFACTPASATAAPTDTNQAPAANCERRAQNPPLPDQPLDPENSEPLQEQHTASKSPTLSSSDSGENEGAKRNAEITSADHEKVAAVPKSHDSNKAKGSKQVDRSSCGSNASSGSEVETDALEKQGKDVDKSKEPDMGHAACDSNNRRTRSSSSMNDSWKEVSEEGRLAFEALFSREVLPQSFSLPHYLRNKGCQKNTGQDNESTNEKAECELQVDLNDSKICFSNRQGMENIVLQIKENNGKMGQLALGSGYGKLKAHRTGFKPYKRCSVEAKESRIASVGCQGEERGPKRIRLEGEAST